MINPDDVRDGIKELERAARLGLAGAEHAKPAPDHDPGIAGGNTAACTISRWRG
jgi:hypothetical protein